MKNTREPSNMQRLLREWTLARYTAALERGDLETLALIMERATQDSILQLMILEIHEVYQDDDLLYIDDKDDDMEIKTGTANSTPEPEALPEQPRKSRRRTAWVRALAAAILVCLLGGGFLGVQYWRASQTAGSGQNATLANLTRAHDGWCVVNSPQLDSNSTRPQLTNVSGDAPNDVWALGLDGDRYSSQNVTEHWNGHAWSVVPLPQDAPGNIDQLNAISAAAPGDAWAVGSVSIPLPSPPAGTPTGHSEGGGNSAIQQNGASDPRAPLSALGSGQSNEHALLEHWNGQQWSIVPFANPYPATWGMSQFSSISVISPNNVWAAGFFEDRTGLSPDQHIYGTNKPLLEHWDGAQWNIISSPAFSEHTVFDAITGVSANDMWITSSVDETGVNSGNGGKNGSGGGAGQGSTLLHWNGSQWQRVASPSQVVFSKLSANSANNIWGIGYATQANHTSVMVIEHWDGTTWRTVNSPDARPKQNPGADVSFSDILAISPNSVWVVGSAYDPREQVSYQVVGHWDGQQWQVFPQDRNDDPGQVLGITSVSGKIWAVGIAFIGLQQVPQPLIETSC